MTGTGHMGDRVRVATGNGAGAPPHCRRRRARVHPAKAQAGRERDARPGRASTPSATAWHKARFAQLLAAACMRFACARVRARVCAALTWARVRARRVALEHHLSVPAPCIPRAAPRTLINLAASERSTRDARCLGLAGFGPEARARAAQPKRGRQSARPTWRAASPGLPRKKWLKFSSLFPPTAKGGAARGGAQRRKKWRRGGAKK